MQKKHKTNFNNTNHETKKQIQQNARPSQRQQRRKQSDKTVQLYQIKIQR